MCRHQQKATRIMNNQGNMTTLKEIIKAPIIKLIEMEIKKLSDK